MPLSVGAALHSQEPQREQLPDSPCPPGQPGPSPLLSQPQQVQTKRMRALLGGGSADPAALQQHGVGGSGAGGATSCSERGAATLLGAGASEGCPTCSGGLSMPQVCLAWARMCVVCVHVRSGHAMCERVCLVRLCAATCALCMCARLRCAHAVRTRTASRVADRFEILGTEWLVRSCGKLCRLRGFQFLC